MYFTVAYSFCIVYNVHYMYMYIHDIYVYGTTGKNYTAIFGMCNDSWKLADEWLQQGKAAS